MKATRTRKAVKKAAALALAAQMAGVQLVLPSNAPRLPAPAHVVLSGARNRRRLMRKAERRLAVMQKEERKAKRLNLTKRIAAALTGKEKERFDEATERDRLISSMTNWQNHQWRRSGKTLKDGSKAPPNRDLETLRHFAALPHWKKSSATVKSAGIP